MILDNSIIITKNSKNLERKIMFGFAEQQIIKNQFLFELSLTGFVRRREVCNNLPSNIASGSAEYRYSQVLLA